MIKFRRIFLIENYPFSHAGVGAMTRTAFRSQKEEFLRILILGRGD